MVDQSITPQTTDPTQLSEAEKARIWHEKFGPYDENRTVSISRDACLNGLCAWAEKAGMTPSRAMLDAMMSEIDSAMRLQNART